MRILKIRGKNEALIHEQILKEYGSRAVIISTQQEKQPGLLGLFQKGTCVVTVAIDEEQEVLGMNEKIAPPIATAEEMLFEKNAVLIQGLQEQIECLRKEVQEVKKDNSEEAVPLVQELPEPTETITLEMKYRALMESLREEGIHEDVMNCLLKDLSVDTDVETLARTLYDNMLTILKPAEDALQAPVVFFVGSTGVGKTTTLAKLTADYVLNLDKKVTLFTADTYRIAAIEQLRIYAEILDVPIETIYSQEDLNENLAKWQETEYIFIDTAGRSHKNEAQIKDMQALLEQVENKQIYLVINMSTSYKDVKKIIETYQDIAENFQLIVTKMDETDEIGNLMNIAYLANCPIAYLTTGQNVPGDIEKFNQDNYVKKLLGRLTYE